ncbi:MAG: lysylphosphatidylglycerol synthase transmembrane domain-containing protein [Bryobacteraceae bacterium]
MIGGGAFLYARQGTFDWGAFQTSLSHLHAGWIVVAVTCALGTYVGRVLRWQVLMRPVKSDPGFRNILSATAIGFTAMILFGRPGELVRPYLIATRERVSFSSQLGAWLLERVYDMLCALLVFGFALSHVDRSAANVGDSIKSVLEVGGHFVAVFATICLGFLVTVRVFLNSLATRLTDALSFLPETYRLKAARFAQAFTEGLGSTRSYWFVLQILAYSAVEWLLILGSYYSIFKAVPATSGFRLADVTIFMGFVTFGQIVQIPGLGGGLQIASVAVLTELFGVGLEPAAGVSVVLWLAMFIVIVPFGALFALREGIGWARVKRIVTEAKPLEPEPRR